MFDITIISYSDPNRDSRTLNFAKACEEFGYLVNCIGFRPVEAPAKIISTTVEIDKNKRLLFNWRKFTDTIKNIDPAASVYLASDLYSLPAASHLAGKHNAKLLYDSREIYSALGPINKNQLKQRIISQIEKRYVKNVDAMIVSGELDAVYLKEYFVHDHPYHIIMNVPPLIDIKKSNILREKYNLDNKKIIVYQGAILKARGIEYSINEISNSENFALVIIGDGPFLTYLQEKYTANNIIFTGAVNYDELLDYTASADIGLSLFEDVSLSYKLALPNKLFEYAMANIPIIATDLPAIRKIHDEFNFGILIDFPFSEGDLLSASKNIINKYLQYSSTAAEMSMKYNYETEKVKIKYLMEELTK